VIEHARRQGRPIRVRPEQLLPIPTSEYPTPAQRPLNSRLSSAKLQKNFGLYVPHWRHGVERMLTEIF
jgi:dTDP-4-dehydrorhamnose reductase